jgi:hypothetical protein
MKSKKPTRQLKLDQANSELHLRVHSLARSTEPANRELMESHVRRLYKSLDRTDPHIHWCDSPSQLFVIPYLIDRFAKSSDASFDQVWSHAEQEFFGFLDPELLQYLNLGALQNRLSTHFPLGDPTGYSPREKVVRVYRHIYYEVDKLRRTLKGSPEVEWDFNQLANTYDLINDRLLRDINTAPIVEEMISLRSPDPQYLPFEMDRSGIEFSLRGLYHRERRLKTAFDGSLWNAILPGFNFELGSFSTVCLYNLRYSQANWTEEPAIVSAVKAWGHLIESLWWIACYEHNVFISERPVRICFDAQQRLHSEDGPALKFKDGYSQYYWHGISVRPYMIEDTPTVRAIEREQNTELRRILIERFGMQKYLFASGAKVVSVDECGTLYRKEMGEFVEPILMVHVVNKTPEPDGSYHDYFLCVPPTVSTAKEAVAWTFGLDADSYKPIVET